MASGSQADHIALGYAHDTFVASEGRPTSPAEREAIMGALIAAALPCGPPPRTTTPIAWIERRLATYRAAFGLDVPTRAQPERIAA
jgi:hypothetical protein